MKNKIALVVLIINIFFLSGCVRNELYDVDDVTINGIYKGKDNLLYLVFSIPQESLYSCNSVTLLKSVTPNTTRLSFIKSSINNKTIDEKDYRVKYVRDNPILLKEFNLDPNYLYIVLDKEITKLNILDSKSDKEIIINEINQIARM
ncbi:hypothetical protein [Aquimarina pacifica]|uniref:hypothetical protein n=1 Tax=Aquimarina pacifica TaxID=1296415 RepID=UPI0004722634|nr:hypothetical protein [Aquimarina pacifica]